MEVDKAHVLARNPSHGDDKFCPMCKTQIGLLTLRSLYVRSAPNLIIYIAREIRRPKGTLQSCNACQLLVGKTPYKAFSEWFISNGTRGTYVEEPLDKPECNPSCCSKLCLKCRKPKPTVAYVQSAEIVVGNSKW